MKRSLLLAAASVATLALQSPSIAQTAAPAPEAQPAPAGKPAEPFVLKDPVAVVDGAEINAVELDKALGSLLRQQGATLDQVPDSVKPNLYRQVLDGVIAEKLVTKAAAGVKITDEDVSQEFERFKGQFKDEADMKLRLSQVGQTPDGIRVDIRRYLQQNRWMDDRLQGKLEVTTAEVEEFYKSNADQFKTPEEVRASHILVRCEKDAPQEEVKTKRETANKILDRVKAGEDFAKLASEVSEDPSAKENKGDLNFFRREQMVADFSNAAFAMKKGDVSDAPVRSEFGFHIIKVTDHKDAGTMSLDEARPRLTDFMKEQKRRAEAGKVLSGLRETAKITVNLPAAQ